MVVRDQLSWVSPFILLNIRLKPLSFPSKMGKRPDEWRSTKQQILRSYVPSAIISMQTLTPRVCVSFINNNQMGRTQHPLSLAVECIYDDGLSRQCNTTRQWRWMSHEYIQHDESRKHAEFKEAKPRSVCGQCMRHLPGMHEGLGLISSTGKKKFERSGMGIA